MARVNLKAYSYDFVQHRTSIREIDKHTLEYRFFVDGKLLKRSQFNKKTKIYSDNLPINNHQRIMGDILMLEFINGAYKLFIILVCIVILLIILG